MHGDGDAFSCRGLVDVCEAQAVDTGMLGVCVCVCVCARMRMSAKENWTV